jgi:hypothetical protein
MNQASAVSAPSAAAARMRKSRERRRHGDAIVSLKVGSSDISDLVALGWMPATDPADKDDLCGVLIELIRQAITLRVTPSTTALEGARFAPLCATAGPTVTGCDEALSPGLGTSAEPGEVLGSDESATEIVVDQAPVHPPPADPTRPFEPDPAEVLAPRLDLYLRWKMWVPDWGPRPGQLGCAAPEWLLDEYGIQPSGLA